MKDLFKSILYSIPGILHMKQSSKPGSLSPGERQDRKAMKEREKQQRALKHLPKLPGNLNMLLCQWRRTIARHEGTLCAGKHPANTSSQSKMLKQDVATLPVQRALHTGGAQQLPGTVIWMMFSSSGSTLICLIPPSSPEVPMGRGKGRQSPTGSSNLPNTAPVQGKWHQLALQHQLSLPQQGFSQASSPQHAGTQGTPVGMVLQTAWLAGAVGALNWQLDLVKCSFSGFLHLK